MENRMAPVRGKRDSVSRSQRVCSRQPAFSTVTGWSLTQSCSTPQAQLAVGLFQQGGLLHALGKQVVCSQDSGLQHQIKLDWLCRCIWECCALLPVHSQMQHLQRDLQNMLASCCAPC